MIGMASKKKIDDQRPDSEIPGDGPIVTTTHTDPATGEVKRRKRRAFTTAENLSNVQYEIRGPIAQEAERLEYHGHSILKLNTGNPAVFGFDAPDVIMRDMIAALPTSQGYSTSRGILSARRAIVTRYELVEGFPDIDVDDVWLGNGVSELISMCTQALLNPGDEVLVPMPDYPLWTASTNLAGGKAVHYRCDEDNEWNPDIEDIKSKVTDNTRAIVIINPNNPTGAVYSKEILKQIVQIAREHELLIFADEIYDRILFDDAVHHSVAALAPDLVVVTFNGLSKAYRVCGYRAGWMIVTGPKNVAKGFVDGVNLLSGMRLCPNVPAQHAIQAALGGKQSIFQLTAKTGRIYEQREIAWKKLNEIPGVSCVKPMGALYAFPKLDLDYYDIDNDAKLMLDLLRQKHILMVQGTGFNWDKPDHFRVVFLPRANELSEGIDRLADFLADRVR